MPDIPPDLAGKVLSADFRNIVKKVGDGGTLTAQEREMLECRIASGQMPVQMVVARRAALLRKWAMGGKLSDAEKAEIAPILPAGRSSPVTADIYKRRLRDYVAELHAAGMKESKDDARKLKSWIHKGRFNRDGTPRDPPDLPPFDALSQLAAWWRRNMEWKVPDFILRLEKHDGAAPHPPPETTSAAEATPSPAAALSDMMIPDFDGGLDGHSSDIGINYIRGLVQSGIAEMNAARKANDPKRYWNARRQFEDDVETLRKWEKDLVKIQEGKGEVLRTRVINEVLVRIFGIAAQSFTNAMFKLLTDHAPALTALQAREVVLPLRDRVFSHVKTTRFATVWKPDEPSATSAA